MGYTHYWYRGKVIPQETMDLIVADFRRVLANIVSPRVEIAGWDGTGTPIITSKEVRFNGSTKKNQDHETFSFPQVLEPAYEGHEPVGRVAYREIGGKEVLNKKNVVGKWFEFCKTAQKPYDIAVTAFLVIAKHYLGDAIIVRSDGEMSDWTLGIGIVVQTLKYGDDFILDGD
jgi:hypothetical protein